MRPVGLFFCGLWVFFFFVVFPYDRRRNFFRSPAGPSSHLPGSFLRNAGLMPWGSAPSHLPFESPTCAVGHACNSRPPVFRSYLRRPSLSSPSAPITAKGNSTFYSRSVSFGPVYSQLNTCKSWLRTAEIIPSLMRCKEDGQPLAYPLPPIHFWPGHFFDEV